MDIKENIILWLNLPMACLIIQGEAKIGLYFWVCETQSSFLYYYLLIIMYFSYEQLQTYFCPTLYITMKILEMSVR